MQAVQSELEGRKATELATASELVSARQNIVSLTESESNLKSRLQEFETSVRAHEAAVSSARAEAESKTTTEKELRDEVQTKVHILTMLYQLRQWLLDQRHVVIEDR